MRISEIINYSNKANALKSWFGNSKVVDDNGEPLILYHATTADFKTFIPGGLNNKVSGHAIWLTDRKHDQPAHHNISNRHGFRDGANVMPVYCKMLHPLLIDDMQSLEWARAVFANGSSEFPQIMPKSWVDEVIKDGEYDGIIFDTDALGWKGGKEFIVFKSNQIKSAISNTTFTDGDDITENKHR
jgi:hypothetical protein